MKKIIVMLLVLAMVLSLAACGKKEEPKDEGINLKILRNKHTCPGSDRRARTARHHTC